MSLKYEPSSEPLLIFDDADSDRLAHIADLRSFGKSQLPHKSVNLSFTITNIKNKLTDL